MKILSVRIIGLIHCPEFHVSEQIPKNQLKESFKKANSCKTFNYLFKVLIHSHSYIDSPDSKVAFKELLWRNKLLRTSLYKSNESNSWDMYYLIHHNLLNTKNCVLISQYTAVYVWSSFSFTRILRSPEQLLIDSYSRLWIISTDSFKKRVIQEEFWCHKESI